MRDDPEVEDEIPEYDPEDEVPEWRVLDEMAERAVDLTTKGEL